MTSKFKGELEVDAARGVLYFHSNESGGTLLRICGLSNHLDKLSARSHLDITIPHTPIVTRSEWEVPAPTKAPAVFLLNELHTTHVTKAQALKERQAAKAHTFKKLYGKKKKNLRKGGSR
jgi:hypothetical protein